MKSHHPPFAKKEQPINKRIALVTYQDRLLNVFQHQKVLLLGDLTPGIALFQNLAG